MSEPLAASGSVDRNTASTPDTGDGGKPAFSDRVSSFLDNITWQRAVVVVGVIGLALMPFGYAYRIEIWGYFIGGFALKGSFFYLLALLPGTASILDHVLRTRHRRATNVSLIKKFTEMREPSPVPRTTLSQSTSTGTGDGGGSYLVPGVTAAILLTSVFLFVAAVADRVTPYNPKTGMGPLHGLIFCGLGAYVSVLYYLGARMYANAISSSFLMNSALRSASAVAFGWAAVSIGMLNALPDGTTQVGALFMSGLFFSWAIGALRAKAMTWFGAPKTDNEELPLGIVEGIDDTTADQLHEYGITTIQHLAETDPAELCSRTLLPVNRVVSWVNQAILITEVKRHIVGLRAAGKGTATKLARCYALAQAGDPIETEVMKSLGAKTVGDEILKSIAAALLANKTVRFFHEYLEGETLNAPRASLDTLVDNAVKRYEVVEGRLEIKAPQPAAPTP